MKHRVLTVPVPRCYRGGISIGGVCICLIGIGIGTADLKKRYRTTGTAVDFESTASKPVQQLVSCCISEPENDIINLDIRHGMNRPIHQINLYVDHTKQVTINMH